MNIKEIVPIYCQLHVALGYFLSHSDYLPFNLHFFVLLQRKTDQVKILCLSWRNRYVLANIEKICILLRVTYQEVSIGRISAPGARGKRGPYRTDFRVAKKIYFYIPVLNVNIKGAVSRYLATL